jgi:hypothetical protein
MSLPHHRITPHAAIVPLGQPNQAKPHGEGVAAPLWSDAALEFSFQNFYHSIAAVA